MSNDFTVHHRAVHPTCRGSIRADRVTSSQPGGYAWLALDLICDVPTGDNLAGFRINILISRVPFSPIKTSESRKSPSNSPRGQALLLGYWRQAIAINLASALAADRKPIKDSGYQGNVRRISADRANQGLDPPRARRNGPASSGHHRDSLD